MCTLVMHYSAWGSLSENKVSCQAPSLGSQASTREPIAEADEDEEEGGEEDEGEGEGEKKKKKKSKDEDNERR